MTYRLFISSDQKEFARERNALAESQCSVKVP